MIPSRVVRLTSHSKGYTFRFNIESNDANGSRRNGNGELVPCKYNFSFSALCFVVLYSLCCCRLVNQDCDVKVIEDFDAYVFHDSSLVVIFKLFHLCVTKRNCRAILCISIDHSRTWKIIQIESVAISFSDKFVESLN